MIREHDYAEALSKIESILGPRLREIKDQPDIADQLDLQLVLNAGDLRTALFDADEGIRYYKFAVWLTEVHNNRRTAVFAHAKIVLAALQAGDMECADIALSRIDEGLTGKAIAPDADNKFIRWEKKQPWVKPDGDRVLAYVYWALARYVAGNGKFAAAVLALECADRQTRLPHQKNFSIADNELRQNLALDRIHFALQCGDLHQAERFLADFPATMMNNVKPYIYVRILELQARFLLLQGQLVKCRSLLERLVERVKLLKHPTAFVKSIFNLCRFYILLNQTAKCRNILDETAGMIPRNIYNELKPHFDHIRRLAEVRTLANEYVPSSPLASIYDEPKKEIEQTVESHCNQSLTPYADSVQGGLYDFEARFNSAARAFRHELMESESPKAAYKSLQNIQHQFQHTDSRLVKGRLFLLDGMFYMRLLEIHVALRHLNQTKTCFDACDVPFDRWQALSLISTCQLFLGRPRAAEAALMEADENLQQLTVRMNWEERDLFMLDKWNFEEQVLRFETNRLDNLSRQIKSAPFWRKWLSWIRAVSLIIKILNHSARFRGKEIHRLLDSAENNNHPSNSHSELNWRRLLFRYPRRADIACICLSDRTLTVSMGFLSVNWRLSRINQLRLRKGIRWWHKISQSWFDKYSLHLFQPQIFPEPPTEKNIEVLKRISGRIAGSLGIDELMGKLPFWIKELRIKPDDALHVFPFQAIWLKADGKYLFQRFRIRNSYGISTSLSSKCRNTNIKNERLALIVDIGSEIFDDEVLPDFPALPNAEKEGDAVEEMLEKDFDCNIRRFPKMITQGKKLKYEMIRVLKESRFVHVVSHGIFNAMHPYKSGLVLKISEEKADVLSVQDIAEIGELPIEHLCMSACYSTDVFTLPGRWVVGLPEVFCRAGVGHVMGFLWPVTDIVGCAMTILYYENLKTNSVLESIHKTRMACFRAELADIPELQTSHPYFWASLNHYGF